MEEDVWRCHVLFKGVGMSREKVRSRRKRKSRRKRRRMSRGRVCSMSELGEKTVSFSGEQILLGKEELLSDSSLNLKSVQEETSRPKASNGQQFPCPA